VNHRERVLTALARKEPDCVPIDLGGVRSTTIHVDGYVRLRAHLGLPAVEPVLSDRMMQVVVVDDDVLRALDVDTRGVFLGPPDESLDRNLDPETWRDEWGVTRRKPAGAVWYDLQTSPLAGDIGIGDIARYPWPNPDDPGRYRGLRDRVAALHEGTDYAVVLGLPSACVHVSQYLRGFEDWYMDAAADQKLLGALLDAVLEVNLAVVTKALDLAGDRVDVVATSDDLGTQGGLQVSPPTFRKVIKPRLARFFEAIHARTKAPVYFHTCGSVYDIIPDLIEIGVDALNPVQVAAANMEPERLKREFGARLSFWGAVDTQRVMPFGTADEVAAEVGRRVRELGPGGGYVVSAIHNLQGEVPPENVCRLFRAARELGHYPLAPAPASAKDLTAAENSAGLSK
jgi:uroporphyrinogen decarboxylase